MQKPGHPQLVCTTRRSQDTGSYKFEIKFCDSAEYRISDFSSSQFLLFANVKCVWITIVWRSTVGNSTVLEHSDSTFQHHKLVSKMTEIWISRNDCLGAEKFTRKYSNSIAVRERVHQRINNAVISVRKTRRTAYLHSIQKQRALNSFGYTRLFWRVLIFWV